MLVPFRKEFLNYRKLFSLNKLDGNGKALPRNWQSQRDDLRLLSRSHSGLYHFCS